ncbi:DUF1934 domain-containing protein [Ornithinibacillus halotolerans]|uniref:DUF1934 domain-containing protein n=1 Tax=Ornithinibacillus halotolerans TaxID=1274357 RepID=A0A916RS13_9BACI|nr:DUF1934 domain-containing protein [Ornithinibacillus halotolerans]GGA63996.1 hypothetical protein GCM10008025_04750 [Ornithinibacillus halotolerans]
MDSKILIQLEMVIEDNGSTETSKNELRGNYYSKKNMDVIAFEEKMDNNYTVKSLITIKPGTVNIKRTGPISMNQQFRLQQKTENVYTHPHGHLHMETFTKAIEYASLIDHEVGHLEITYHVKLNGQDERNHKLTLQMKKEDK